MAGETIYRQRVTFCGKPGCRPCQSGRGHGPYWYAYETINGRTKQTYVGKVLPPHLAEASTPAALIRLYALGQVRLERRTKGGEGEEAWYPLRDTTWATVRPLLGALASNKERRLSLHQVRELLGSKASAADVQRLIERLRSVLEPPRRVNQQHILATRLVEAISDSLELADQTRLWIDADAFESLISQARATDKTDERERLLEEALLLYNGDYWSASSGREAPWVLARRQGLRRQWLGLLLDLADLHQARGDGEGAMHLLDRLLAVDPTNEAAVQRLLLLLAQSGRRGEALRLYQRFLDALNKQDERMLAASETQSLYEAIRSGETPQHLTLSTAVPKPLPPETQAFPWVGRSNQSHLVGRDQELAALLQMLLETEQQRQQRRCIAVLTGEAGIGKTRLVEELGREATQRGWAIAWSRAYAQETTIPYRLWTEILRKALRQGPGWRQELTRRPMLYQPLLTLLPDLEGLLPPDPAVLAPEQDQTRLWEAIRALLLTISERTPLLIVLDDVQWADTSSSDLLAYLVRQLQDSSVLIAATCRDSELPPTHSLRAILRDLQQEQVLYLIAVPPLTDEQIRLLVSGLPDLLVRSIQAHAAGNPFFAEELAHAPNLPSTLPDTIAAVLDLRLARVSDTCQRLLGRASVLGGSFEFSVLRAMERGTGAFDEDQLLDLLEEALQAGILMEEGSGTRPAYSFWHPLVVTHLYAQVSAARRTSLHRRAAQALQESAVGHEQEEAAAIVYHLENGNGDPASISTFAELAGDRAYHLSAYRDAERYYRLVFDQRAALSSEASRDERLHRARISERLGECAMIQGQYEEARLAYEQVLEIRTSLAQGSLDPEETQMLALVWGEIGWAWHYIGENAKAWHCCMRGTELLASAGVSDGPAWASLRYQYGNFCWLEGRYEEASAAAREALISFTRPHPAPAPQGQLTRLQRTLLGDPVNAGRIHILLAAILTTTGEQTQAEQHLQEALVLFEEYEQLREIAIVSGNLGDLYLRRANHEAAQAAFRRALSIAEHMNDPAIRLATVGNLGVLAARRGNVEEAVHLLRQALKLAEAIGDQVYQCLVLTYLAPLLSLRQAHEEAFTMLSRALRLGRHIPPCAGFTLVTVAQVRLAEERATPAVPRTPQERIRPQQRLERIQATLRRALSITGLEAEIHLEGQLALAEAHLLSQEITAAESVLSPALDEARRQEWPRLVGVAQRLLGEVLAARRQMGVSRDAFEEALTLFRSYEMRLEEALTLWRYGHLLLQHPDESATQNRQDGQRALEEARHLFQACHVPLE